MSNYNAWISSAREYLETAKLALENGRHGSAYYNATHSAELALKSLLVNLNYPEESYHSHNEIMLFNKIKSSGHYPNYLIDKIDRLIMPRPENPSYNIPHTDIAFDDGYRKAERKCDSGEAPNTRYPIGDVAPSEYLSYDDANVKIELADKLIGVIENYFSV